MDISYKIYNPAGNITALVLGDEYNLKDDAVGIMFVERIQEYIKIYPVVWVRMIDTFFFENACGSGTVAVSMVESWLTQKTNKYAIKQPSGDLLEAKITIKNNIIIRVILKGKITADDKIRKIII